MEDLEYKRVYDLVTHVDDLPPEDIFQYAVTAVLLGKYSFYTFKRYTYSVHCTYNTYLHFDCYYLGALPTYVQVKLGAPRSDKRWRCF